MEADYEKVDRLLDIREHSEGRLAVTDKKIAKEKKVSMALVCGGCYLKLSCISGLDCRRRRDRTR